MSIASGSVVITLKAIDKASGTMNKVKASMSLLGNQISQLGGGFQAAGNIMQGFAGAGVIGAVTVAVGEVIKIFQDSLVAFTDFETALIDVSSASGKTGDVLIQLEKELQAAAKTAGVDFGVGATEAMKALESLVKAGLEGEAAIIALNGALALAKIESISTAEASDMLIGVLGMFKLSAEEAAHATDVLVNASIQGIGTAAQFARGLAYVGGRAEALGFSLEETTAALVALNNQGINATSAGQYLNMMFTALITKSDRLGFSIYDASGNMLSLAEISGNLVSRLQEFETQEERNAYMTEIFGARAGIAANALMGLGDSGDEVTAVLAEMTASMGTTGTAMDIVDAKTDTLAGTQARLDAMMENLQLTLGEGLAPVMAFVAEILEDYLIPFLEDVIPPIVAIIDAVMLVIKFFVSWGKIMSHYLQPIINNVVAYLQPLIDAFMVVADTIGFFISSTMEKADDWAISLEDSIEDVADAADLLGDVFDDVADSAVESFEVITEGIDDMADEVVSTWDTMVGDINAQIQSGLLGEAQKGIHDFVNCTTNKQAEMVEQIDGYLNDLNDAYVENRKKIHALMAAGKTDEANMLLKANEEIRRKLIQLMAWREQIIADSWAQSTDIVAAALQEQEDLITNSADVVEDVSKALVLDLEKAIDLKPSTIVRELDNKINPIRSPDPITSAPMTANITLEFTDPILDFDARAHAEAILSELRALQEEEEIQRFKLR